LGISKNKESQHCGTKPKTFALGIAPLGIVSIGIVPMGVFSFGAVAMGIVNLSVVGMGIISAGITTMGVWEYSPKLQSHNHNNHAEKIMPGLYETREKAEKAALNYGCIGAHKMGKKWMPCKHH